MVSQGSPQRGQPLGWMMESRWDSHPLSGARDPSRRVWEQPQFHLNYYNVRAGSRMWLRWREMGFAKGEATKVEGVARRPPPHGGGYTVVRGRAVPGLAVWWGAEGRFDADSPRPSFPVAYAMLS